MRVVVHNHLDDLKSDLAKIPVMLPKKAQGIVNDGARYGAQLARANAKRTAGKHGKHYPRSITAEAKKPTKLIGLGVYSAEYGPNAAMQQGNMSFEHGSRNQPPHLDLAKSADVVGPIMPGEVRNMLSDLFWPGA